MKNDLPNPVLYGVLGFGVAVLLCLTVWLTWPWLSLLLTVPH